MYLGQKQDMISQIYVSNEVSKFVDSIKNTGYLSKDMYLSFYSKLSATNISYDIEITHAHKVVEPKYDEIIQDYTQDYTTYFYNIYLDDILTELDNNGCYYFSQGDYISLHLVNQTKTLATRLQEILFSSAIPEEQIFVTYGGLIRSEVN